MPHGGLAVAGLLAQKLGVAELVDEHVTLHGAGAANGGAKALTVIGAALAGGDCIDDVDVLRAGTTPRLFDGVKAPSTVGGGVRSPPSSPSCSSPSQAATASSPTSSSTSEVASRSHTAASSPSSTCVLPEYATLRARAPVGTPVAECADPTYRYPSYSR